MTLRFAVERASEALRRGCRGHRRSHGPAAEVGFDGKLRHPQERRVVERGAGQVPGDLGRVSPIEDGVVAEIALVDVELAA